MKTTMNTFLKVCAGVLVFGFAAVDDVAASNQQQTEAKIAAQILEFEKGAAESAIKYKHESIRPARPPMMFDGDSVYPTCGVTMNQFRDLRPGMSYQHVAGVLGCDGIPTSESNSDGLSGAIYGWQGAASKGANMSVQFQRDRMINKSQSGLR